MKKAKKTELIVTLASAIMALALMVVGVFAQSQSLRFFGPVSRIVTPNSDSRNDLAIFCFDNPSDSEVTGKIYSLIGSEVAPMGPRIPALTGCPAGVFSNSAQSLTWDGRSNGTAVHSGVYIYRITSEQRVFSGTLIVVR